jgi:hypothetical protein
MIAFPLCSAWLLAALTCLEMTGSVVAAWIAGTLVMFGTVGLVWLCCAEPLSDTDAVLYREKLEVE